MDEADGDGYSFECQHGPDECAGNIVIDCGQKYITDYDLFLEYNFCLMGVDDPYQQGQAVSSFLISSWFKICYLVKEQNFGMSYKTLFENFLNK